MQVDASKNQNLAFSYTTSSGKNLSMTMFDNQSVSYTQEGDKQSLNLRREYGFSFSYQGSQLTQQDLDEIQNAMKEIEPLISDFLESSKVGDLKPKDFIQNAMKIANLLPTPSDENTANATMSSLVDKFNSLIKEHQSSLPQENTNMLEDSKKLIEEILEKIQEKLKEQQQELQNKDEDGLNLLA
ncbi:ATP-binding protein [Campylobacter sp. MIT 12-8780]|uniref:ATP-binding protein n=1 Tax=unclassified Campylobacter TaxID=2593542 RepID=UPI00115D1583|nr:MULTISPECIES: ATP-binding protein [unclassified Campylobacter]NDJ26770.1 coiled-coil domain-containing protein 22 [Campylobacter sp. MIT 19-121]TQR42406.1 ATP-binding protein [Campylobacter sp. MIT 12-8780]